MRAIGLVLACVAACDAPTIHVAVDASAETPDANDIDPAFTATAELYCRMQEKCFPYEFAVLFGDFATLPRAGSDDAFTGGSRIRSVGYERAATSLLRGALRCRL